MMLKMIEAKICDVSVMPNGGSIPQNKRLRIQKTTKFGPRILNMFGNKVVHKESTFGYIDQQQESNKSKCATLLRLVSHKL
jgi:hypothetical protein